MKTLKEILLFLWQLPQTIIGVIYLMLLSIFTKVLLIDFMYGVMFVKVRTLPFGDGISLGCILFYQRHYFMNGGQETNVEARDFDRMIALHEYGHHLVSILLGPLYLLAAIICICYSTIFESKKEYHQRVFEKWADDKAEIWYKQINGKFEVNYI